MSRPAWYMTKAELFRTPGFRWLIARLHAYPVRRGRPDRAALMRSLAILKDGGILIIFPEGHRTETGQLQAARRGAAFLACKSGAPVIPVGLMGPYGLRRRVTFRVGRPVLFSPATPIDEASEVIIEAIAQEVQKIRRDRGLAPIEGKV